MKADDWSRGAEIYDGRKQLLKFFFKWNTNESCPFRLDHSNMGQF